ncbi:MAG: hypothetical protein ACE15C_19855 [Phycisphaerae bacterium]
MTAGSTAAVAVSSRPSRLVSWIPALCGCFLALVACPGSAQATDYYWQVAGEDNWANPLAWSTTTVPSGPYSYARVTNGGTVDVTMAGAECTVLYLDNGSLSLSGTGQLSATSSEVVGYHGKGAVVQMGGTNTITYDLQLGYFAGATGTYQLGGTGQLTAAWEKIGGESGAGSFVQIGGANTVTGNLYLSHGSTYELGGSGQLTAVDEVIGSFQSGTFTQTGGSNSVHNLYIARNTSSGSTYRLSGTGRLTAANILVGSGDAGIFQQTSGSVTVGYLSIDARSLYQWSGGSLNVLSGLAVTGALDFMSYSGALTTRGIVDLSRGTLLNSSSASLTIGPKSSS